MHSNATNDSDATQTNNPGSLLDRESPSPSSCYAPAQWTSTPFAPPPELGIPVVFPGPIFPKVPFAQFLDLSALLRAPVEVSLLAV